MKQKYEMGFPFKAVGRTGREQGQHSTAVGLDASRGCKTPHADFRQRNREVVEAQVGVQFSIPIAAMGMAWVR